MNYKKLTDEELLEAMEFCIKKEECGKDCSLYNVQGCMWIMFNQSFDLIHRLQKKIKLLEINLVNECEEHKQFVKLAKQIDEQQKAEIERMTEELDYYKGANRELTGKNTYLKQCADQFLADYEKAQKQVDELKEERENMQAEIMRFEDMKFTQEHCNLYEENEWLKANLQQAVKDTAKEILCELLDVEVKDEDYKIFFLDVCDKLEKFAQKYGVEVE